MPKSIDARIEQSNAFSQLFAFYGMSCVFMKTCTAPIERIKILYQTEGALIERKILRKPFCGLFDCASSVIRKEGVRSLWRGNFVNVLRYYPAQTVIFYLKYFQTNNSVKQGVWEVLLANMIAGGIAGSVSLACVYPLDFARTRLATDLLIDGGRRYDTFVDVYTRTLSREGIRGLYRGLGISTLGVFLYRGCYFGFFESLSPYVDDSLRAKFALGYVVTVFSGLISYPIDTIRRRMIMTMGGPTARKCALAIFRESGYRGFVKGASANILRSTAGAGALATYDQLKQLFTFHHTTEDELE